MVKSYNALVKKRQQKAERKQMLREAEGDSDDGVDWGADNNEDSSDSEELVSISTFKWALSDAIIKPSPLHTLSLM